MADIPQSAVDDFVGATNIVKQVAHGTEDYVPTDGGNLRTLHKMQADFQASIDAMIPSIDGKEDKDKKNAPNGYPGLTGRDIALYNADGSVLTTLRSVATAARALTVPDKDGVLATTDDVTAIIETIAQPNGLATLDNNGKVPAGQLPSFVDDVLEFANFAALPGTGESGKIYVTQDTNTQYRWSGNQYIELVASPGTTDAVPEGTGNLYFTENRVRGTKMSGISTATSTPVVSGDDVIGAIGKLQAQTNVLNTNNTGVNTGDETAGTIKGKLGISTLSGSNTGDETLATIKSKLGITTLSGDNTGDETTSTIQNKLGGVPILAAEKGAADGVVPLGSDSKIASAYLPSYVDDVLEYGNLAGFPATGEAGKIYVAADTSQAYRWSGSTYVVIVASPGTTDNVVEGSTNLYFTVARVRSVVLTGLSTATNAAISAGDTVLGAFGKLQAQVTDLMTRNTGTNTGDETITTIQNKLGGAVVLASTIGAANGITPLGSDSKIPAVYLPSFVDDVLEFNNAASFPATGETGKIYVALDTNLTYRWSGSAYIVLVGSPGTTDAVPEGASNLYFTETRVRASLMTGLSLAVSTAVVATDSLLVAIGKLQKQHSDLAANNTGSNTGDETLASIKSKLGITTLSGSNTGDETQATILTKLGATPVYTSAIGAANGIVPLGSDSKIASTYLPSYVDDVLEFANLAAFPGTGETGKIYTALDTNYTYRWSGSAYIQLVSSPGSSDAVPEGSTNLYFTAARVRTVVLTGLSTASSVVIDVTDTVLSALGKLQAQITTNTNAIAALVVNSIASGDTTHAPSRDSVFTALAAKLGLAGGTLTGKLILKRGADIVAAATTDLSAATGDIVNVTGNTGITGITLSDGQVIRVRFTGTPTLTNGASLSLLGAANLTMQAGDIAEFYGDTGSVTRMTYFSRLASLPVTSASPTLNTPTFVGFTEQVVIAAASATGAPNLTNGSYFSFTTNANFTLTMPTVVAGKSFSVEMNWGGAHTMAFAGATIRWTNNNQAPQPTSVSGKLDIYTFTANAAGTAWVGQDGGRNA